MKSWMILFSLREENPIHLLDAMREHLKGLKKNIRTYFFGPGSSQGGGEGVRKSLVPCDTELSSSEKGALIDVKSEGELQNDSRGIS
jgi:hypothetical protein